MAGGWHRPEPLDQSHVVAGFSCGSPALDDFLLKRALANQVTGATKTHVCVADGRVVGYYSLCSGGVARAELPSPRHRRNMPAAVPVVLLARLAVDAEFAGSGLGSALLGSAIATVIESARAIGVACLLVHALDAQAAGFYRRYDFEPSPTDPLHLLLMLKDVPKAPQANP